jgi:hypothetical protein
MAIGIRGEVGSHQKLRLDLGPVVVLVYGYTGKEDDPADEKF